MKLEASDLFAAIGPVSAVHETTPCRPVQESIDFWVKRDGCSVTVKSEQQDVDYYGAQDGGHAWPGD